MRPIAVHAEGFGVFREPVDIDFDDVDYFALVGPTGVGKSTVIDAVCFALYGSVPRYGDERLTARVVSIGKQEAKVSLQFSVGEVRYRATRVVRIRGGKSTTPEAILERLDADGAVAQVLASSARELKPAVEQLLGLPFAHFTKCVVLPQGEFARFLHDEPSKRRDLLTRILDLQVYDRVGQLARTHAAAAKQAVEIHEQQRARFADATDAARTEAQQRRERLLALHHDLDAARPRDQEHVAAIAEADARVRRASELAAILEAVVVPREVAELTRTSDAAATAARAAGEALVAARAALATLDDALEALPDRTTLERARDAHAEAATLGVRLDKTRATARAATADMERVAELAPRADHQLREAEQALEAARATHAAHALAADLEPGEPCPVCLQVVEALPKRKRPAKLDKAEAAVAKARELVTTARAAIEQAARGQAEAESAVRQLEARIAENAETLAPFPDPAMIEADLVRIADTLRQHAAARARERDARAAETAAQEARTTAEQRIQAQRSEFEGLRDGFVRAGLDPPPAEPDLAASWSAMRQWCATARAAQREEAARAVQAADEARAARKEAFGALRDRGSDLGVDRRVKDLAALRDAVLELGRDARHELQRIDDALDQARKLDEEIAAAREEHVVAELLGTRLRSDRFEKWLLVEALDLLVSSASATLYELSSGQYSLRSSADDEFVVVDHRNADETRSVRTLSGGETFQASLALALSLSDQLAELSVSGGAKLEAIFLDEGFGTLDADTLETVATTIESLGTSGRMVGIVTHVPALAERVPVRYRVSRSGRGAEVTREDA
jgi:exonuclease SbcC